jgi:DNA-binding CsgD family transcriptional regulator
MEWASDLSVDNAGRERRLLMAAVLRVCSGHLGSSELWSRAQDCAPSALRTCALAGRAVLTGHRLEAEFHLVRVSTHGEGENGVIAAIVCGLRAELSASAALGRQTVTEAMAGLAAAPRDRALQRWLTRLLAAGRCYAAGPRAAIETLADFGTQEPAACLAMGSYRVLGGEPEAAIKVLSALGVDAGQARAPEMSLRASQWLALAHHLLGEWRQADDQALMAVDAARPGVRGGGAAHALCALLSAHRGDWDAADKHLRAAHDHGDLDCPDDAVLADIAHATIAHARGVLLPGHPALDRLAAGGDAARKYRSLWLPLQAEALIDSGPEPDAATALAALRKLAEQVPYLRVTLCRLSGRLAERRRDPIAARRHYEAAADLPQECRTVPFLLGLLDHCHGRLLCGLGAATDGPASLNRAAGRLASAGAIPYARRCAADLAARQSAAGGAAQPSVLTERLTERERAVVRLVAVGLTNQEVAARLYVSAKTVEYHLAQIYGKLGIKSRRQLARYPTLPPP